MNPERQIEKLKIEIEMLKAEVKRLKVTADTVNEEMWGKLTHPLRTNASRETAEDTLYAYIAIKLLQDAKQKSGVTGDKAKVSIEDIMAKHGKGKKITQYILGNLLASGAVTHSTMMGYEVA